LRNLENLLKALGLEIPEKVSAMANISDGINISPHITESYDFVDIAVCDLPKDVDFVRITFSR